MLVSIIIPIYNTAEFLAQALDSVQAQTYTQWECICVDDGSTDGSADIVAGYVERDPRFRLVRQANAGQSVARNTAMDHVRGEYVYMMDSDDVLVPTLLHEAVAWAESTQADVVFFNADVMGDAAWTDYRMATGCGQEPMTGEQLLYMGMKRRNYRCCVWLMLVRRTALVTFYPGIIHEDELFTARLLANARRVVPLDRQLVHHRVRSGSTMRRAFSLRNVDCYVTVCRELEADGRRVLAEMAHYIMPIIFRTAATLPFGDKPRAFAHMIKAGWGRHISLKVLLAFWVKG